MSHRDRDSRLGLPPVEFGELLNGKYRIVRRLGQGGMGAVFEAQHQFLQRRFAVKFLRKEHVHSDEMIARFRREAQAAGRIENENVAAVVDFGFARDDAPYIVMEYLQGEDLGRVIAREGQLTVPRAVSLLIQACRGAAAAHAQGVVHRDLKPDNLFICQKRDGSEQVKVLDFGIAKLQSPCAEDIALTNTGATLGTPCYMSPEQARGENPIDCRTDIYSLGAVLYEALTGRKAHPGSSYNEIIYHIISREPESLVQCRPGIPTGVADAVRRAMAQSPSERHETADDLADALFEAIRPRSALVDTDSAPRSNVTPSTSTSARDAQTSSPRHREVRRRPTMAVTLVVFGALGVVGTLFSRWRHAEVSGATKPHDAIAAGRESSLSPKATAMSAPPASSLDLAIAERAVPPTGSSVSVARSSVPAPASREDVTRTPRNRSGAQTGNRTTKGTASGAAYDLHNPYE